MNLWADFDDTQHNAIVPVSQKYLRRLTEQVVLSSLRDWLLHKYVPCYCHTLAVTRIFRRCYWIDGLGGQTRAALASVATIDGTGKSQGKRRKTNSTLPPALEPIVTLSRTLGQESVPIALYGLLLTADKKAGKASQASIPAQPTNIPRESGIVKASWSEIATTLLAEIDQSPALFLLNPFGKLLFNFEQLAALYQRTVPTELLLFFSHQQLLQHFQSAHKTQRASAQAATLTALVRSDRWKALPTRQEESQQAIDGLIELLVASMQRYFLLPVQSISLPILLRPPVVERVPYTLLFATRRQDSLMSMNDAICSHERAVYTKSYHGLLTEEWFVRQQREQMSALLEDTLQRVQSMGRAQRIRRWPDLRQQVLLQQFGALTITEYDSLIQQLLARGIVRCEWKRSLPMPTGMGEHIPGNEDTLFWT